MNFWGQGRPLSDEGMDQVCGTLGVSEPEVWAALTVETRGFGPCGVPGTPNASRLLVSSATPA